MSCKSVLQSFLMCILVLSSPLFAVGRWQIDFQGDMNHLGVYDQTDPVDTTAPGVWNIFEVPALDTPWPGPNSSVQAPMSLALLNDTGKDLGVTFTNLSDAWGWAGDIWGEPFPLQGDCLLLLNDFGVDSNPTNWEITGLVPDTAYELTFYHAINLQNRGIDFVANGIAVSVYGGYPTIATITVVTDPGGTISGSAASNGTEGDWSGLVLEVPTNPSNPNPADGETKVALDAKLSWTNGQDPNNPGTVSPDITKSYLWLGSGTANEPNLVMVATLDATESKGTYDPGLLQRDGIYFWQVENSVNDNLPGDPNNRLSPVWSFKAVPSVTVIQSQPQDTLIDAGQDAVFVVEAVNPFTNDSENLRYLWYMVNPLGFDVAVGDNTDILTIANAQDPDQGEYYCVVSVVGVEGSAVVTESAKLITKKLIAHWPLDTDPNDITGNGYGGTLMGNPTFVGEGMIGGAISLDGVWDYVDCGDFPITDSGNLTISTWVKPTNIFRDWIGILSKWNATGTSNTFWMGQHYMDGWIRFGLYPNNGDGLDENAVDSGAAILANGQWTHITCTYDGVNQKIYSNGALIMVGENRNWPIVDAPGSFSIGCIAQGTANFGGLMDDVRLYNYAMTPDEVGMLYLEAPSIDFICVAKPQYDFNDDCRTTIEDFALFAADWLECGAFPTCITSLD